MDFKFDIANLDVQLNKSSLSKLCKGNFIKNIVFLLYLGLIGWVQVKIACSPLSERGGLIEWVGRFALLALCG